MRKMNLALVTKLVWKISQNDDGLWACILKAKYTPNRSFLACRDESGAESFRFFRGKMKMERKYENRNENENGIFCAETETKMEQCFLVEQTWKRNFSVFVNMKFWFLL